MRYQVGIISFSGVYIWYRDRVTQVLCAFSNRDGVKAHSLGEDLQISLIQTKIISREDSICDWIFPGFNGEFIFPFNHC